MKFKVIEPKRNCVELELAATPYILTDEELKKIEGGAVCGIYIKCGEVGKNSCEPFDCSNRDSCTTKRVWREDLSIY